MVKGTWDLIDETCLYKQEVDDSLAETLNDTERYVSNPITSGNSNDVYEVYITVITFQPLPGRQRAALTVQLAKGCMVLKEIQGLHT